MKKLSICYVTAQYLPHMGGVERYTQSLSEELVRMGHSVTIVTSTYNQLPTDRIENGIRIIRMPSYQLMDGRYPIIRMGAAFRRLEAKLKEESFDYVVINTRFYPLSLWGARFAQKKKLPCWVIEHGTAHLSMGGRMINFAVELVEHTFTRILKHYKPQFLGVSEAACQWLKHFQVLAKGVVYNTVDYQQLEQYGRVRTRRIDELGLSEDTIKILFAGRLIKEKGILQLTEAVKQIGARQKVALIIVGQGPLEKEMQALSAPIYYLGAVDQATVIQLLNECEVFCLPSDSEGFPTAVLEAAACGICVVATTYGGTGEILSGNQYGVQLKDNSVEEIRQGLESVINQPEIRKEKGQCLQSLVKSKFTWQNTANTLVQILSSSNQGEI